jgi:copper(I)-binding protein
VTSCSSPVSAHTVLRRFGTELEFISLPAGDETVEAHVQLLDIRRTLSPGDLVSVTLFHSSGGGLRLQVPVQDKTT